MSEKLYIFSTLSSDVAYTNHAQGGADMPIPLEPVLIKGGAGIVNDRIVTPRGVVTEVTESQLEYLRANSVFQLHEKNGFIMVSGSYADPDKAAADMTGRDHSAPVVPQDAIEADAGAVAVIGGEEIEAPAPAPRRGRTRKI